MMNFYTITCSRFLGIGIISILLLATPTSAFAFFSAPTSVSANVFSAGTLVYTLNVPSIAANISTTTAASVSFTTTNAGSIVPQYRLTAQTSSCTNAFYGGLQVSAEQGTSMLYQGALSGLVATSSSSGVWHLSITPGSAIALPNDTCKISLTVDAWQPQFQSVTDGGFSANKTVLLTLTSDGYLGRTIDLNEILPNPETASTSPPYASQEFVELYNNAKTAINVLGWKISEMTGSGTEVMREIVASGALASQMRPYANAGTVINSQQPMAFVFGGSHSYLNNTGDTVRLYDARGVLRDAFTYTSSIEGESYAREPDGVGAWVDPRPTPNALNTSVSYMTPIVPIVLAHPALQVATTSPQEEVGTTSTMILKQAIDGSARMKNVTSTATTSLSVQMPVLATATDAVASSTENIVTPMSEATTTATSTTTQSAVLSASPTSIIIRNTSTSTPLSDTTNTLSTVIEGVLPLQSVMSSTTEATTTSST